MAKHRAHTIKCPHCIGTHGTVAEVKECFWEEQEGIAQAKADVELDRYLERYWEERDRQDCPEQYR